MDTTTPSVNDAALMQGLHAGIQSAAGRKGMDSAQIDKAANAFESQFLSTMLGFMFDGEEVNPVFGGGAAEEIYRSMLVDEYGKMMQRTGGIGVADQVRQELLKIQEAA
jgi:flagellar protein FlgJ